MYVRPSVCLFVCHALVLCQNDAIYDNEIFTNEWSQDSTFASEGLK